MLTPRDDIFTRLHMHQAGGEASLKAEVEHVFREGLGALDHQPNDSKTDHCLQELQQAHAMCQHD